MTQSASLLLKSKKQKAKSKKQMKLASGYSHICGGWSTTWKGYQVSGGSVFKCEMSSEVICHMIWVATWQCCTYGADLEDRKESVDMLMSAKLCHTFSIHQMVLDPPEQAGDGNIFYTTAAFKHEEMQSAESATSMLVLRKYNRSWRGLSRIGVADWRPSKLSVQEICPSNLSIHIE